MDRGLSTLLTVSAFMILLDLAAIARLSAMYEYTLTKILAGLLQRVVTGTFASYFLASLLIYFLFGVALGLLGIGMMKYLAEEIGLVVIVGVSALVLYNSRLVYRPENMFFVILTLVLFVIGILLSIAYREYRGLIRIALGLALLLLYAYFYFKGSVHVVDLFAAIYLYFIVALLPTIVRVGRNLEYGVRAWTRVPKLVRLSFGLYFAAVLLFFLGGYVMIESIFTFAINDSILALLPFLLSIPSLLISSIQMAASDTIVVAAVVNPKSVDLAVGMAIPIGLFLGPRRLYMFFKVFGVLIGILLLLVAEERKSRTGKEAGAYIMARSLLSFNPTDIFYIYVPYLIALLLMYDDDRMIAASFRVITKYSTDLLAFGILAGIYVFIMSFVVSTIGALVLYYSFFLMLGMSLSVTLIAILIAVLFPIVYPIMSPASAAAKAEILKRVLDEHKKEIEVEIKKIETEKVPERPKEMKPEQLKKYLNELMAVV